MNREDRAAYMREWRARHRDVVNARRRELRAGDKDRINAERRAARKRGPFIGPRRPPLGLTPEQRFWAKVDKSGECWIWLGAGAGRAGELYGNFRWRGKPRYAHRIAYELQVGPIPDGLQLDHLCREHRCVNPAHLEPVTNRENVVRGIAARTGRLAA